MTRPGDGFLGVAGSAGRVKGGYQGASRGRGAAPKTKGGLSVSVSSRLFSKVLVESENMVYSLALGSAWGVHPGDRPGGSAQLLGIC